MNDLRLFTWDDLEPLAELGRTCVEADKEGVAPTVEQLRASCAVPGMEAERFVYVLPDGEGGLAASCTALPMPGHVLDSLHIQMSVHPSRREGSLQTELLRYVEARGRENHIPSGRPAAFLVTLKADDAERVQFYEANGYRPARWFLELERDLTQPIGAVETPPGLRIRTVDREGDVEALHTAITDAFRDHWNPPNITLEQARYWVSLPQFKPELVLLALDASGEAAGACINSLREEYNRQHDAQEGAVETLGVRRPYRRRGLARALLMQSLHLLKEAGMTKASLGVDADSLTGATKLYASVGFVERKRIIEYHKSVDG